MNFTHAVDPLYSVCGFVGGLLVGMTGVGGGSLMTPLLILLFGVHPATAVGTDLLYAAATKTGGSLVHGLARRIDWKVVRRLAAGSVPSTVLTLLLLSRFDIRARQQRQGRAERHTAGWSGRSFDHLVGAYRRLGASQASPLVRSKRKEGGPDTSLAASHGAGRRMPFAGVSVRG